MPVSARVLVVDDQPVNIQVVGNILGKLGYEIVPAADGTTALKRMALRTPDLILLDVIMPDMSGFEVCRQIRENPAWKDIPVIFVSAADDKELVIRAFNEGGVDYVTKPFNHAELLSRVKTHLTLKAARDRLYQLAEDKDELLGILAHDLKNHLSGMQLSAQLLKDRMGAVENPKTMRLVDNMCQSTGQLLVFVKEFLANASVDHGLQLQKNRVSMAEAVNGIVLEHQEASARKNLQVLATLPQQDTHVYADSTALNQVLDNLLSNAVKFSQPDKEIKITVRVEGEHVVCVVQDEGPGFTPEDKKRMFRRYGRLSARPTGGEPSTGLGLSIVKKLMQEMGGEVICESEPGAGATFTLRLPVALK
ncbi:MAG TPA: hybrid sensor histidine kinase/response regulator [Verrucomicrobiae bacterium]